MTGGTYTLVVELPVSLTVEVGALGTRTFEPGWYAYAGSALGPGGFARVDRHRELAAGERATRHWHVDYLLGSDETALDRAVTSAGVDAECDVHWETVAADGVEPVIPGFGASDCDCGSHLAFHGQQESLVAAVRTAHAQVAGN